MSTRKTGVWLLLCVAGGVVAETDTSSVPEPRAAHDVLFLSVQPDIPFLRWQCFAYLRNFIDVGVRPAQVVMLFALERGAPESTAVAGLRRAGARVAAYADDRPAGAAFAYTGSIRLFLLAKFVAAHADELEAKRVFYHDADIVFPRGLPRLLALAPAAAAAARGGPQPGPSTVFLDTMLSLLSLARLRPRRPGCLHPPLPEAWMSSRCPRRQSCRWAANGRLRRRSPRRSPGRATTR